MVCCDDIKCYFPQFHTKAMGGHGFCCQVCNKVFNSRMKLRGHERLIHQQSKDSTQTPTLPLSLDNLSDSQKIEMFDLLKKNLYEKIEESNKVETKLKNLQDNWKKLTNKNEFKGKTGELRSIEESTGTYDFFDDDTVPKGWKSCTKDYGVGFSPNTKKYLYWAPDGRFCRSRRAALLYMSEHLKSSEPDLEIMKDGLIKDGWQEEDVMDGWFHMKIENKNKFISNDFRLFRNIKEALEHLIMFRSDKDIEKFISRYVKTDSKSVKIVIDRKIPVFWKVALINNNKGQLFLAPDGTSFTKARSLLEFLHKSRISKQEKITFQSYLLENGFCNKNNCLDFGTDLTKTEFRKEVVKADSSEDCTRSLKSSLPKCLKLGDNKSFVDSQGRIFPTVRSAYKILSQDNTCFEDLQEIREYLCANFHWRISQFLPKNWLIRKSSKNDRRRDKNEYLTDKGDYISTGEKVVSFMQANNYPETEIEIFKENAHATKFTSEPNLPEGWKIGHYAEGVKAKKFMDPNGKYFVSRSSALRYMVEKSYSTSDIDKMRQGLKDDGWERNDLLPDNFMVKPGYKGCKAKASYINLKDFNVISSSKAMKIHLRDEKYSEEACNNFEDYLQTLGVQKEIKDDENDKEATIWHADDMLPSGWTQSTRKRGFFEGFMPKYKSPGGKEVLSIPSMMKMMKLEGSATDEDFQKGEQLLRNEGWSGHENFPDNWKVQKKENKSKYLSDNYEVFRSCTSVIQYMKDNNYDDDVIRKAELNLRWGGSNKGISENKEEIKVKEETKDLGNTDTKVEPWRSDPTLPKGWKMLSSEGKEFIKSNNGDQFSGRKEAIDFMIKEKYSPEDIFKLWNTLHLDGWMDDADNLPTGWKKKKFNNTFHYLSPLMDEIFSKSELLNVILEHESDYSKTDIDKVRRWSHHT